MHFTLLSVIASAALVKAASPLEAHARGEHIVRLPTSCPDGEYLADSACVICPEGYFCTSSELTPCPAGTTAPIGSSECAACPTGFICNAFRTVPALVPRQSPMKRDSAPPSKRDSGLYPRQSPMKRDTAPPTRRDTGLYARQSPMKRDTALYARQSPMKRDTSPPPSKRDSGVYPRQSPMKRDTPPPPSKRDSGIYPRQSPMKRDTSPPPSKRESGIYARQSPMKRDTALLPRQSGAPGRRDAGLDTRQNAPTKRSLVDEPVVPREEGPASAPLATRDRGSCTHKGEISCPAAHGHGFDCIRPMSDLESCGGCVVPDAYGYSAGVDCTVLEGVDNVECVRGGCLIRSCAKGYKFSHNGTGCVRLQGDPRNLLVQV